MLTLPYPGQPATNSSLASAPVLANINAIAQAIQSFDASQVQPNTLTASAFNANINPNTILNDTIFPFVQSGCTWGTVSGLQGTMSSGVLYAGPSGSLYRISVNGVGSYTFTASKDTYIDIDYNGNIYYQAVSNDAASPSITANSIRVAIVVTNGTTITFVNQGQTDTTTANFAPTVSNNKLTVCDSLGNLIYPTDPFRKILAYRQITSQFVTSSTTYVAITGLSATVQIPASRKIKIKLYAGEINSTNSYMLVGVMDGTVSSSIANLVCGNGPNTAAIQPMVDCETTLLPSSTTKTYIPALRSSAGTSVNFGAGSGNGAGGLGSEMGPAYLQVELA